jgi:hypothetical protein
VSHWTPDHAAMADVDPTLLRVSRCVRLNWANGTHVSELAGSNDEPLIAELRSDDSLNRRIYWLFDLADSDLPSRLSFPVLLWNTLDYLAHRDASEDADVHLSGRPLRLGPTVAGTAPLVYDPAGRPLAVMPDGGQWRVPIVSRRGIYRTIADGQQRSVAVNCFSDRGTRPMVEGTVKDPPRLSRMGSVLSRVRSVSWQSLLMAGVVVGVLEWVVFNRRWLRVN